LEALRVKVSIRRNSSKKATRKNHIVTIKKAMNFLFACGSLCSSVADDSSITKTAKKGHF
jgi:hypothetical protein